MEMENAPTAGGDLKWTARPEGERPTSLGIES